MVGPISGFSGVIDLLQLLKRPETPEKGFLNGQGFWEVEDVYL